MIGLEDGSTIQWKSQIRIINLRSASVKVRVDLWLLSQFIVPHQVVCDVAPGVKGWRNGAVVNKRVWYGVFSFC